MCEGFDGEPWWGRARARRTCMVSSAKLTVAIHECHQEPLQGPGHRAGQARDTGLQLSYHTISSHVTPAQGDITPSCANENSCLNYSNQVWERPLPNPFFQIKMLTPRDATCLRPQWGQWRVSGCCSLLHTAWYSEPIGSV